MSSESKEYFINWKNHMNHMRTVFENLLTSSHLSDVTLLSSEGTKIKAHKLVLSACSSYFHTVFKENQCQHPIIVMYGVEFSVLSDILKFIYNGEVSVDIRNLDAFLNVAQFLKIHGLSEGTAPEQSVENQADEEDVIESSEENEAVASPSTDKKSIKRKASDGEESKGKSRKQEPGRLVSQVKCEPVELSEDPYEPADNQSDPNDETLDNLVEQPPKTGPAAEDMEPYSETKPKHSNFSEDCLKCNICSKVFSHPYSLHHHKAVHSGNTECPICHAVLSRKYNLKMHMKARHNL